MADRQSSSASSSWSRLPITHSWRLSNNARSWCVLFSADKYARKSFFQNFFPIIPKYHFSTVFLSLRAVSGVAGRSRISCCVSKGQVKLSDPRPRSSCFTIYQKTQIELHNRRFSHNISRRIGSCSFFFHFSSTLISLTASSRMSKHKSVEIIIRWIRQNDPDAEEVKQKTFLILALRKRKTRFVPPENKTAAGTCRPPLPPAHTRHLYVSNVCLGFLSRVW